MPFRKPSGTQSKGMYELKEAFYKQFNPFFYHYSRQEQSAAMDAQKARLKQQGKDGESQGKLGRWIFFKPLGACFSQESYQTTLHLVVQMNIFHVVLRTPLCGVNNYNVNF